MDDGWLSAIRRSSSKSIPFASSSIDRALPLIFLTYDGHMARSVSLQELIASGRLHPGQRLVADHRGVRHSAELTADGSIRVEHGDSFPSPSSAAASITGHNTNGWRFWGIELGDRVEPLADLRLPPREPRRLSNA